MDPSVIRDREEVDELLAMLDADVVGGMPFRVRTYKNPGADRWYNVIINRSHMLATLVGIFLRIRSVFTHVAPD